MSSKKKKVYELRIDPCTKFNINYVHNFYRFCDMNDPDLDSILELINKIKNVVYNIDKSNYRNNILSTLSFLFPYKDKEHGFYYKLIEKIMYETEGYNDKCIPDSYTSEMRIFQYLYIAMIEIIMDIFSIANEYKKDDNIPKNKLTINDINIALSQDKNYEHFYA